MPRTSDVPLVLGDTRRRIPAAVFVACSLLTSGLGLYVVTREPLAWQEVSPCLLAGTVSLVVAVLCHARVVFSLRDACLLFVVACGISYVAEYAGIRWGVPFGSRYRYHDDLQPQLPGQVPLFIPLAWFVLAYAPLVFLQHFRVDLADSLERRRRVLVKTVLCAALLMTTDLFLDPLATSLGAWQWAEPGAYLGIPIRNYRGWFLVGLAIYGSFFLGQRRHAAREGGIARLLDAGYVGGTVFLTTLANFKLWHQLGDELPAILTTLVLGPACTYWYVAARPAQAPPRL
jgi:uncharacterized membrane protein